MYFLLVSAALWGGSWWPYKEFALAGLNGASVVTVAYTAAFLVWLPSAFKHRTDFKSYPWALVSLGLVAGFSHFAFAIAMVYGSVIRVMMLFYLAPLWAIIIGYIFLREPLTAPKWIAVICSIVGAFAILGGTEIFAEPPTWIDVLAIAAGLCFAAGNVLSRFSCDTNAGTRSFVMFFCCAVYGWIFASLLGSEALLTTEVQMLVHMACFGALWLGAATWLTNVALEKMQAGNASIIMTFELIVGVITAMMFRHEMLTFGEAIGGSLVFAATLLVAWKQGEEHESAPN